MNGIVDVWQHRHRREGDQNGCCGSQEDFFHIFLVIVGIYDFAQSLSRFLVLSLLLFLCSLVRFSPGGVPLFFKIYVQDIRARYTC